MNVTVYVDGKRVTEEEMKKIELRQEGIKRILAEKMYNGKKEKEAVGA